MARERSSFARYAFHHVAVAAYDVDVIVEHGEIRPVEVLRQPPPGQRHAYAVAATLAQRAGCRFDARGEVIFGMARTFAAELPKPLDIVERNRRLAQPLVFGIHGFDSAEMEYRVEQHRSVAIGQHEAIAIGPDRVLRIEPQKILPDGVAQRRQCHRRARMAGIRLLHGIHRERANGVYAKLIQRPSQVGRASLVLRCVGPSPIWLA